MNELKEAEGLFPNLKPKERDKKKRDRILTISILCVAVFFVFLAVLIGFSLRIQLRYREYYSALSTATTQAYELDSLIYEMEGETHSVKPNRVKRDKIHSVYKIMTMKKGIEFDTVPDSNPTLVFRYPQSALLEIWQVPPTIPSSHKTVLRWRFTNSEGKYWIFEGDYVSVTLLMNSITKAQ